MAASSQPRRLKHSLPCGKLVVKDNFSELRVDENIRDFAKWPSVRDNVDKMLPDISAAWMRLGFKQTI